MTKSKDLFQLMRQQEIETPNFLPTKKEIQLNTNTFIDNIINAGEIDKKELFAQARRLQESLNIICDKLLTSLPQENFEAYGIKGTFKSGYDKLNYLEDYICNDLAEQLKSRQELVKLATKSKDTIYDSAGVEVTRVSSNPTKDSLTISF